MIGKSFQRWLAARRLSKIVARKKASEAHRQYLKRREAALRGLAKAKA